MRIEVEFLAQARTLAGVPRTTLELAEGAGVAAMFRALLNGASPSLGPLLQEPGLRLLVFVDDVQVDPREDPALREGARVLLTTPMAGG